MGNEHVIPEIIRKFKNLKGKNLKIQGSGNEIRSFIYIDDFVQAFNLLLKKGKHLEIYNIGTTDKIKIKKLVLKISNILKKKIILKKTSLRIGGTKKRLPDITKLRKLGFKQKVKIDQGLKKSIDFYF
jgi:nucleoside-diphosphate-sugar epimerase